MVERGEKGVWRGGGKGGNVGWGRASNGGGEERRKRVEVRDEGAEEGNERGGSTGLEEVGGGRGGVRVRHGVPGM